MKQILPGGKVNRHTAARRGNPKASLTRGEKGIVVLAKAGRKERRPTTYPLVLASTFGISKTSHS